MWPHAVRHQLIECVRGCPRRLPRDPPATDDRPTEVPPGEGGGAAGILPAAERHPGGAVQERCGKEHEFFFHNFNAFYCPMMPEQIIYYNTNSLLTCRDGYAQCFTAETEEKSFFKKKNHKYTVLRTFGPALDLLCCFIFF